MGGKHLGETPHERKLKELQRKAQMLRQEREKMFQNHERERVVFHQKSLESAKQIEHLHAPILEKFSEKERERDQTFLAIHQKETEQRKREESLEEYRKEVGGIRGVSKGAGRVRKLNNEAAISKRNKTLRARRRILNGSCSKSNLQRGRL